MTLLKIASGTSARIFISLNNFINVDKTKLSHEIFSSQCLFSSCKQIRQGRLQGVGQCLVREYRMVCHVMQGKLSRDFFEVSSYSHISLLLISSFEDDLRPPLLL